MSGKGSVAPCEKDIWHGDDPAAVVQICLSQLPRNWPSVRVACLLEGSVSLSLHACERISANMSAHPVRINASDFCPVERERLFWFSFPVTWSWERRSSISRTSHILHISRQHQRLLL